MKKSRKIKFFVGFLMLSLLLMIPITKFVNATEFPASSLEYGSLLYPGDYIDGNIQWIDYYDYSNNYLYTTTDKTVFSYKDASNMNEDPYAFKCWKIKYIYSSAGEYGFTLEPVDYDVYNINYELNGGVNSDNNPTYYLAGKSEITLDSPTREHYSFGGWYSDEALTVESAQVTTDNDGDLTFYAKWTPDSYDITYVLDGGVNADSNPDKYSYGVGVNSFAEATKTGYKFIGWFADSQYSIPLTSISIQTTGDKTLYAKFEVEQYDIVYNAGQGTVPSSNPDKYTYGVGVDSFAAASLDNYVFKGWYDNENYTNEVTSISTTTTGTVELFAKFEPVDFDINYVLNGGSNSVNNPDKYTYTIGVDSFEAATKTGYTFNGWYSDSQFTTKVTNVSTTQTGAVTLYAKFTANEYAISYVLNGGANAGTNPIKYTYGVGVTSFAEATKTGFTFNGWYSDADFTTKVTNVSATQTGDVTLYAKFTANEYAISYVLNGGINASTNPAKYTYGVGVASFVEATKTGYTFNGWYSDSQFTTKVTNINATQTGAVTLYAKFTANEYAISYVLNGGANSGTNPVKYTYGVGVTSFVDATKTGFTFNGWYSDADFTTKVTNVSTTQTGDVTLYAKFTANEYAINYVLNGGANASTNPAKYTYGVGITSFAEATKTGYTFAGWYSDSQFTTKVTNVSTTQTGAVTLYAKFTANEYAISYVLNGGANASSNPTGYTYGVGVTSFAEATKTGYTFAGWYSDSQFTTKVTNVSTTQTGTVTLYAKFTANEYAISYVLNGGANASSNPTGYTYGVGVTSFAEATKTGYTFNGWYSDAQFTTKVTAVSATQTGAVTLYAKFTANDYAINYVLNGGVNATSNPTGYTYGAGVASFAPATKTGYTFNGWYSDAQFTTKVTAVSATQTGVVTLYAKFTANEYAINYVLNGGANASTNPAKYTYGVGITSFSEATKTGFTFNGWYSDADFTTKVTAVSATQTGAVTLYAKFTANDYAINYVLNGGVNATSNPTGYTYGAGVASFAPATKTGYTFNGWYSDADFTTKVTAVSTTQTGTVTLYAKFTANDYAISYVLNGGANAAGNPTGYTYGVGVTSFAEATKTGFTFNGWYSDAALTTKVTAVSATQTGAVTLYAKFTAKEYNITYVLNGGTNAAGNPVKYTYGVGVTSFAAASKEGYTFGGWYSDEQLTTKVTSVSTTNEGEVTLYAKFSVGTYAIEYVLDGGTNSTANPDEYTYGVGVAAFEAATKLGYTFEGWYGEAAFENAITNVSATSIGKVTLYAKFTPNVYAINYETNGGELGEGAAVEYTFGTGVPALVKATKLGFDFAGWYGDATLAEKVEAIGADVMGDVTLYAGYEAKKFSITYVLDGGVNSVGNPAEYTYGVGVDSFEDPYKENYKFLGWYADEQFTTKVESIPDTAMADITLYAKFEAEVVAPPTGDNSGIAMILTLLAASGVTMLVLRKREELQ